MDSIRFGSANRQARRLDFDAIRLVLRAPSICPSAPYPGLAARDLSRKHHMLMFGWYRSSCWEELGAAASNLPVSFLTAAELAEGKKESAHVYGVTRHSSKSWAADARVIGGLRRTGLKSSERKAPKLLRESLAERRKF